MVRCTAGHDHPYPDGTPLKSGGETITFEFLFFRLHIFNCKRNNGPTDLHSHSMKSLEAQLVLQKYNSSEFTSVVFDIESVRFTLYNCMASANTYIVNSNLTFVSTA